MRRGEVLAIAAAALIILSSFAAVSIRSLPVMRIEDISSSFPLTPSISRVLTPCIGVAYPGISRRAIEAELSELPYISSAELSFRNGYLDLEAGGKEGVILFDDGEPFFFDGNSLSSVSLHDAGALYGVYPMVSAGDGVDMDGFLEEALLRLVSSPSDTRLITWVECVNNIEDGLMELRIDLPELNASIVLNDPSALDRLDMGIGIIVRENENTPGRTVFGPPAEYELHSDRLIRIKG